MTSGFVEQLSIAWDKDDGLFDYFSVVNSTAKKQKVILQNVWGGELDTIRSQVLEIWRHHGGPTGQEAEGRLRQIVFVVKDEAGKLIGISTAFKAYISQLRNHFYAIRLMLVSGHRIPGLTSHLLVSTRDFLESVHGQDDTDQAIGLITLVENPSLKQHRNEAVWPASGMVYIGNSKEGHHIRVYYFKGARISP
jgi:hypothetical protein